MTLLLALFSVGIGAGSLLCGSPVARAGGAAHGAAGAIGLSLFALDLWWASPAAGAFPGQGLDALFARAEVWRVVFDLVMIGVCGGFFIVPLYALVQQRSAPAHRARVIAGNNILNALFMVAAAAMGAGLLAAGFRGAAAFLGTACAQRAGRRCAVRPRARLPPTAAPCRRSRDRADGEGASAFVCIRCERTQVGAPQGAEPKMRRIRCGATRMRIAPG